MALEKRAAAAASAAAASRKKEFHVRPLLEECNFKGQSSMTILRNEEPQIKFKLFRSTES